MTLPKLHVAVLMGGWSNERPVSLMSGEGVAKALEERGHRVTRIDMGRDVAARLAETAPDVVFNALHGTPGEDGTVQGMMDLMGLTYTHSGMVTSVIAIDKELTKQALVPHGIPMPGGRIVETAEIVELGAVVLTRQRALVFLVAIAVLGVRGYTASVRRFEAGRRLHGEGEPGDPGAG